MSSQLSQGEKTPVSAKSSRSSGSLILTFLIAAGLGSLITWKLVSDEHLPESQAKADSLVESHTHEDSTASTENAVVIDLPKESWESAGIAFSKPILQPLNRSIRVTGRVELNEDRLAHIHPLVAGRVDSVNVQFGQTVKAGDVLVVVQSPEIGKTKLELYRNRLLYDFAQVNNTWSQDVLKNTQALIRALSDDVSIDVLEQEFQDRPIGDHREKLLSAYARLLKTRADFERLESLSEQGITPGKQLVAARAARDADWATFQALLEQIAYDSRHTAILSEQSLKEAETRILVDEASLKILGYEPGDLVNIDPALEGETLSHYSIRAPFNGTIISKDVVLLERVNPEQQILSVADLSTVWVTADIFEQHLSAVENLEGQVVQFRSNAWKGDTFQAEVFYTGEIVDPSSRTVALRGLAQNSNGRLKPGMFVEIDLPTESQTDILLIPETAIQEYEGEAFVFVHLGEDQFIKHSVRVGERSQGRVEIFEGLDAKDDVVVQGGFTLKSRMLAEFLEGD